MNRPCQQGNFTKYLKKHLTQIRGAHYSGKLQGIKVIFEIRDIPMNWTTSPYLKHTVIPSFPSQLQEKANFFFFLKHHSLLQAHQVSKMVTLRSKKYLTDEHGNYLRCGNI